MWRCWLIAVLAGLYRMQQVNSLRGVRDVEKLVILLALEWVSWMMEKLSAYLGSCDNVARLMATWNARAYWSKALCLG